MNDKEVIAIQYRKISELEEEIKKLKSDLSLVIKERDDNIKQNRKLKEELGVWLNANKILRMHDAKMEYDNKKLKEENELLKQCLDEMMFKADVVNIKIHLELWDYCYVRSDKQFKLNIKD